ncbi:SufS family cysteine desulfurase [Candidatus Woesearchaeota archaeon]|nr:SufS family cysteine desulfurase [Candidatus Woesearchaeota archaeon]
MNTKLLLNAAKRAELIKRDFPLLNQKSNGKGIVYIDNAATTQKPKAVLDAMNKYYSKDNANVHRGIYPLAEKATEDYEHSRQIVASFIGATPQETIFTSGTTESINVVARALEPLLKKGDEIVLTVLEHHSNLVPWQELAKRRGAVVRYVGLTNDQKIDLAQARKIITAKTKIVAFTLVSNVLGTVTPAQELIGLASRAGAYSVVDAAQAIAHYPLNVKDLKCDFLAFSGHKMFGPTGIGVLYGRHELLEELTPVLFGGEMVGEVTFEGATWNDLPWKWEAGTPKIAEAIGLGAAVEYLQKIDRQRSEKYLEELTSYARIKMEQIEGLKILNLKQPHQAPIITFTMKGIHPHDIAQVVSRFGVCIRAGHHCAKPLHGVLRVASSARVSLAIYNTPFDIDMLCKALRAVEEVFVHG